MSLPPAGKVFKLYYVQMTSLPLKHFKGAVMFVRLRSKICHIRITMEYFLSLVSHMIESVLSPMSLSAVETFDSCTSRPDVCQYLVLQIPTDNMSKNTPSPAMAHVACESKLRSVVRSSMHPCPGNWVAIGRAVDYHVRVAPRIQCRNSLSAL